MRDSFLIRIVAFFLGIFLILCSAALEAVEIDSSLESLGSGEKVEDPNHMTQKEINDLFGEDPYLGQTSYLQSPDGFSQKEKY